MNRHPCRICCPLDGRCILCGLAEHARCFGEFHRCDGGYQVVERER